MADGGAGAAGRAGARHIRLLRRRFTRRNTVIEYLKTMMRNEPVTFGVMILMIAILIFGAWDSLRVVKRYNAPQTDVESPKNP